MRPSERAPLPGPAREGSDDPSASAHVIENAAAEVEDLIVATAEEVPPVVFHKSTSSVDSSKAKKTHKSWKARPAEGQESVEKAEQASLAARRTLEVEYTPSAGPVEGDKTASLKNSSFHTDLRFPSLKSSRKHTLGLSSGNCFVATSSSAPIFDVTAVFDW